MLILFTFNKLCNKLCNELCNKTTMRHSAMRCGFRRSVLVFLVDINDFLYFVVTAHEDT